MFASPHFSPLAPAGLAPLTYPTWGEEQFLQQRGNVAQTPTNWMYQPELAPSELPFGQQETQPTLFGPLMIDPSLPPPNPPFLNKYPSEDG